VKSAEKMNPATSTMIDVRIPTEEQILENPKRAAFIGGGWVDSSDPNIINLYWHRRQIQSTVFSLLQVLEHESIHAVLIRIINLETSMKLDNIHRCSCIHLTDDKLVFVNEVRIKKWMFPPYLEQPTEDLLD
jgi:predicted proteasome-type protease